MAETKLRITRENTDLFRYLYRYSYKLFKDATIAMSNPRSINNDFVSNSWKQL